MDNGSTGNATERLPESQRRELFQKLAQAAVGLDITYELATGERSRRVYLDSTASTLRLQVVEDILAKYQPFYSNTHSILHFGAKLSTREYDWTHRMMLDFVHADPELYTAFYVGSGTTGGINRVARTLRDKRPDKDIVITSIMEHHSNDLPHRKHAKEVVHIPAQMMTNDIGALDLSRLAHALEENTGRVNYVAVTAVSNVTGIVNPIHKIAKLAHQHGALIVVDAAQAVAHQPMRVFGNDDPAEDIDVLVFSGHKIYAPGSPGVVITRKDLFAGQEPMEVGGGMVDDVYINRYMALDKFPDREEAGTPNIPGAIGLAASLYALHRVGMDLVAEEETELINYALEKLADIDDIVFYGETDPTKCERAGAVSFNIRGMDHAQTAAILNDYFNIAVRNECFCAHPYVREMITEQLAEEAEHLSDEEIEAMAEAHKGMVRASFGVYSTKSDVDDLAIALKAIVADREKYEQHYDRLDSGDYEHRTFKFEPKELFCIRSEVDSWLEQ